MLYIGFLKVQVRRVVPLRIFENGDEKLPQCIILGYPHLLNLTIMHIPMYRAAQPSMMYGVMPPPLLMPGTWSVLLTSNAVISPYPFTQKNSINCLYQATI